MATVVAASTSEFGCVVEPDQLVILDGLTAIAEVGIQHDSDVAVVGAHVVVLAPSGQLWVVEPRGVEVRCQLELEPTTRIAAATERHALLSTGKLVELDADGNARIVALPSRVRVGLAAPSGIADQLLLATGEVIEEWNAVARAPVRRFHLDATPRWIGGTAKHVWFITETELVAIKRDGSAPPTRIALPEPITAASGDRSGVVAILGTSRPWLIRIGERTITPLGDRPVHALALGRDAALAIDDAGAPELIPTAKLRVVAAPAVARKPAYEPAPDHDWRDALVAWMKAGAPAQHLPACTVVREAAARIAIDERDLGVVLACYGARLCGHDGATFADLVELTPGRWTEVMGHGSLRASGAFVWHGARVHLAPELLALFDGAAPVHGRMCGTDDRQAELAGRLQRIVAPAAIELAAIAAEASLGALFVPEPSGLRAPARFLFEARARGVVPLVPWRRAEWPRLATLPRAVVVVDDARVAADLGPVSWCWPETLAA